MIDENKTNRDEVKKLVYKWLDAHYWKIIDATEEDDTHFREVVTDCVWQVLEEVRECRSKNEEERGCGCTRDTESGQDARNIRE